MEFSADRSQKDRLVGGTTPTDQRVESVDLKYLSTLNSGRLNATAPLACISRIDTDTLYHLGGP
jgi:hypothetical protein